MTEPEDIYRYDIHIDHKYSKFVLISSVCNSRIFKWYLGSVGSEDYVGFEEFIGLEGSVDSVGSEGSVRSV